MIKRYEVKSISLYQLVEVEEYTDHMGRTIQATTTVGQFDREDDANAMKTAKEQNG